MQRPIMDPLFLKEDAEPAKPRPKVNWNALRMVLRGVGWCIKGLLSSPLRRKIRRPKFDEDSFWGRFARGAVSRLVFLPLFLAIVVAVLVYCGTHPPLLNAGLSPTSV